MHMYIYIYIPYSYSSRGPPTQPQLQTKGKYPGTSKPILAPFWAILEAPRATSRAILAHIGAIFGGFLGGASWLS